MAKIDVNVPDIGDFKDVPVIEVLVKPGDVVKAEQSLVTLESDKATMDVPSPIAGAVAEVVAKIGDKVSMGTLIARIDTGAGESRAATRARPPSPPRRRPPSPLRRPPSPPPRRPRQDRDDRHHGPRYRRLQGRAGHRSPGEGGRHRRGRTAAGDARIRQGDDGRAVAGGRQDHPAHRQGRRQGVDGRPDREARRRRTGRAGPARRRKTRRRRRRRRTPPEAPETPPVAPRDLPPALSPGSGPAKADFSGVFAGPAVRRLARELDLDLNTLKGTGEKGRITREDVKAALSRGGAGGAPAGGGALPAIPAVDFAKFGPIETVALSRIKRISGPRLHASWVNVPHVTHCDEADITELDAFRKTLDEEAKKDKTKPYRVSLLPLLLRATVATLKAFPTFNAALSPAGDSLILRRYWHIGVAVDTPDGLVVAVIKDVDRKGVVELARELGALSEKARAGKLAPAEMQGATFTISSLGGIGGTAFSPIVNAPEVAILGVVRSKMAPVWDGKAFRAAADAAALPVLRSSRHRRRRGGAVHAPSGGGRRGHAARASVIARE